MAAATPRRRVFAFGWNAFHQLGEGVGGGGGGRHGRGGVGSGAAGGGVEGRLGALGPPPGGLPLGDGRAAAAVSLAPGSDGGFGVSGGGGVAATAVGFAAAPIEVTLPVEAVAIGAGHYTSYAVGVDDIYAWGRATTGQALPDRRVPTVTTPSRVPRPPGLADPAAATAVTGSGVAAFALTAAGGLTAWGTSVRGQLGTGPAARSTPATTEGVPFVLPLSTSSPSSPLSPSGAPWTVVAAGWGHAAAIDAAGGLSTWGHDGDGQLGRAAATTAARFVPALVAAPVGIDGGGGGGRWVGVAAGMDHTVGLDADGGVHTWGCDAHGEAGHPPRRRRQGGGGRGAIHVAAMDDSPAADGEDLAAAVRGGGAVGSGKPLPPLPPSRPRRLVGLPPMAAVAAGFAHTLLAAAPMAGGGIWACGWDGDGQLGLGRRCGFDVSAADADASTGVNADVNTDSDADIDKAVGPPEDCVTSPTLLPASVGVVVTRLAAGRIHSAAVTDDGRLFTWGGGSTAG
ncbi:hypothetical protein MMPV_001199 [Pyropia vietnamensis]